MAENQERLGMRAELDDKPFMQALARIEKQLNKLSQATGKLGPNLDKSLQKSINSINKLEVAMSKLEKSISKTTSGNQKLGNSFNTVNTHMNQNARISQQQTTNYQKQTQAISRLNMQLTTYTRNSQTAARTAQQTAQATATATATATTTSSSSDPYALITSGNTLNSVGNQLIAGGAATVYGAKSLSDKYEEFAKNQLRIYVLEDNMDSKGYRNMQNKALSTAKKYGVNASSFSRGMYDAISVMDSYENFKPDMDLLGKGSMGFLVDPTVMAGTMSTGYVNFNLDNQEKMKDYFDSMYAMVKTSKAEMSELAPYISEIAPWFSNSDPDTERAYREMFTLYGAVSKTQRPARAATLTQRFMVDYTDLNKNMELNGAIHYLNSLPEYKDKQFDYLDTSYMKRNGAIQTSLKAGEVYEALKAREGDPTATEYVQNGSFFGQVNTKKYLETIMNNDGQALKESIKNMGNRNGMVDEAYSKIMKTDEGKYMASKERLDAELVELGRNITPVLADLVGALNGVLKAVNALPDWLQKLIAAIVVWGGAASIMGGAGMKVWGLTRKVKGGYQLLRSGGALASAGTTVASTVTAGATAAASGGASALSAGATAATTIGATTATRNLSTQTTAASRSVSKFSQMLSTASTGITGFISNLSKSFSAASWGTRLGGVGLAAGAGIGTYSLTTAALNANNGYLGGKVNDYFTNVSDSKWGLKHLLPWNAAIKGLDSTLEMMGLGGFGTNWDRKDIRSELNQDTLNQILKKGYQIDETTGQLYKVDDSDWTETPNDNTLSPYYNSSMFDDKAKETEQKKEKSSSGFQWRYGTPDRVNFVETPTLRKMMDITGSQSAMKANSSAAERSKQTVNNNLGGITFVVPKTDDPKEIMKMIESTMTKVLTDLSKNTGRGGSTLNSSARV